MKRVTFTVGLQVQVPYSDAVDCMKEGRMRREREREVEEGRMVLPERCTKVVPRREALARWSGH